MTFLELTGVQKQFGDVAAVQDFNLAAERGEFVSFLGPSGCGKTTTLRMIAGFEMPTAGTITVDGADITRKPPNQRNVGMVFQSYALFPNMTVADNIGFGLKVRGKSSADIRKRVDELLGMINLPDRGNRYPYQLSGGQQQRVALARALAIEPQVLLLDEPLSALDAKIRISLRKEIRAIQRQLGITTVYVTHDQEEALSLSDRVVVMSDGRIEQIGTPFEIYNYPSTTFVASFVGTLNLVDARRRGCRRPDVSPWPGRRSAPRGPSRARRRATGSRSRSGRRGSTSARDRKGAIGSAATSRTSTSSARSCACASRSATAPPGRSPTTLALDTFNEPHLTLPAVGEQITVSFPPEACFVLAATGGHTKPAQEEQEAGATA